MSISVAQLALTHQTVMHGEPVFSMAWCYQHHRMGPRQHLNTLRLRQNGRHFADDTFKCIFLNENARISLKKSFKFVPKLLINNIPALVQIMAWRRSGDKPLSEPMMVNLMTHICVTWPQWVNLKWIWMDGLTKDFKGDLWSALCEFIVWSIPCTCNFHALFACYRRIADVCFELHFLVTPGQFRSAAVG